MGGPFCMPKLTEGKVSKARLQCGRRPATRLLQLARLFAAEPAGIGLDEIAAKFAVSRRTAERMRDAVAEVFPQLEEVDGERTKRWRLPNGLSGIFREPLADELAVLRGVARSLEREGVKDSATLLDSLAANHDYRTWKLH